MSLKCAALIGSDLQRIRTELIEPDHIFVGHTENAPFIDGSFDLVIMNQVIEHLPDPATVLHATKKALKPKALSMSQLQILVGFLLIFKGQVEKEIPVPMIIFQCLV